MTRPNAIFSKTTLDLCCIVQGRFSGTAKAYLSSRVLSIAIIKCKVRLSHASNLQYAGVKHEATCERNSRTPVVPDLGGR